jgi:hypothetical protein
MMFVEMLNQCLPTNQIMLCDNLLALCGITITWLVALCFPRKVFSNSLHRHTHWGWAELEVRLRNNTHIHENAHDYLHTIVTKNYIYTNVRITNLCTYITWWRRYFFSIPIPRFYSYSPMGISQSDSIDLLPQSEYMCGVCEPIRASRQLHFYTVRL